jgi:hypothetical protein
MNHYHDQFPFRIQLNRDYYPKISEIYQQLRTFGEIGGEWTAYDMFGYQHIYFKKEEDLKNFQEWVKTL